MERKGTNPKRCWQLRLLGLVLLSLAFDGNYVKKSQYNIEMYHHSNGNAVGSMLILKFVVGKESVLNTKIILNDKENFLNLEQTKKYFQSGNTVLEFQYKINKAGNLRLDDIFLVLDNIKIRQPMVSLDVVPPNLDENTKFRIRIFKCEHNFIENKNNAPLILGDKYLALIEGFFEKNGSDRILMQHFFKDNILVEKNSVCLDNLPTSIGWTVVASFLFYPLNTGVQYLGEIKVIVQNNNKKEISFILENKRLEIIKKGELEGLNERLEFQKKIERNLNLWK